MTKTHIVVVTFRPKSEHLTAFTEAMQSVKNELPSVEGCEGVRVMTHHDDPTVFMLIEDWENADKHEAHINNLVASGKWAGLEEMLAEQPTSVILAHFQ
ncbi:MAG: antibiotic biosynthesis monooxygenase [Lentilitoribacter sp.]